MMRTTIFLAMVLAILVGQFFLQYWLSTRQDKWLGLILPVLSFLMGIIYSLSAITVPAAIAGFLLGGGICCAIHLLLYRVGRGHVRARQRDQVEKMNIQDL